MRGRLQSRNGALDSAHGPLIQARGGAARCGAELAGGSDDGDAGSQELFGCGWDTGGGTQDNDDAAQGGQHGGHGGTR
jgi:hypothetical protein